MLEWEVRPTDDIARFDRFVKISTVGAMEKGNVIWLADFIGEIADRLESQGSAGVSISHAVRQSNLRT
jgi:hypothetical protein